MSEPVTNVQMEDVLSSIRRLVSEEIGQSGLKPLEKKKPEQEPDVALVLSPAQKIRQDAAEQGEDLWDETADLAPKAPAPLWWHRDFSGEDEEDQSEVSETAAAEIADTPATEESAAEAEPLETQLSEQTVIFAHNPFASVEEPEQAPDAVAEDPGNDDPLPEFQSRLGGAIADLEAVMSESEEEWEPEEGDELDKSGLELDEMPWSGAVEVDDVVIDEFLERESLSLQAEDDVLTSAIVDEPLAAEADEAEDFAEVPPFEAVDDVLEAMPLDGPEAIAEAEEPSEPFEAVVDREVAEEVDEIPFSFRPGERLFERLNRGPNGKTTSYVDEFEAEPIAEDEVSPEPEILTDGISAETEDQSFVLDEDMLRDMVHDIVRQELQGVLGERITRNVRKLVRREIQRAFSDLGQ